MSYLTTKQYGEKVGKSVEWIKVLCRSGRLGAQKIGRDWVIPADAPYPADMRFLKNREA